MKNLLLIFLFLFSTTAFYSCKHEGCTDPISVNYDEDADKDDGSCEYAGTGGNVTLVGKPEHHGDPITSKIGYPDSAFLKFNAINSPGSNPANYDLVVAGEDGEDHVHIENLKPGRYYLYMTGFDSSGMERVFGGIPIFIQQAGGEFEVAVPVSE